jgi:hypothetical protein
LAALGVGIEQIDAISLAGALGLMLITALLLRALARRPAPAAVPVAAPRPTNQRQ